MKTEFLYNGFVVEKHRFTGECEVYINGKFRKFETLTKAKEYINNFLMN